MIGEYRLKLICLSRCDVPDGLNLIEGRLVIHCSNVLEHGAVSHMMAIENGLLVSKAIWIVLVVHKNLTTD